jgi:carboxyl-terminal processing protease
MSLKSKIKYTAAVIALTLLIPVGYLLAQANDLKMLYSVIELIKKVYIEEVTDKKLVESALSGMLSNLDPHSSFLNKKELAEINESVKGEFGGIGVEILAEAQGLRVISPIDDTPAYKAGVESKDLIFAINDDLIGNMTPSEAIKRMRGPKGSKLKISIIREGLMEPLEINLKRDIIKVNPVKFHLYDDIAYIRIATFSDQTALNVKKAFETLTKEAKKGIKGYVLDLRNNPGGILEQSIKVTDFFIDEGVIVSTKSRIATDAITFESKPGGTLIDRNVPLVALINSGSASASEIVAGALQDHKRALILGTKSFGKGSVQNLIEIPEYGAIKITTSLYYTPSGRSIQAEGIVPDITIEPARIELLNTDTTRKYQRSESTLKNHLPNKTDNNALIKAKTVNDLAQDKKQLWKELYEKDYQLARAIDILKSMELLKTWQ